MSRVRNACRGRWRQSKRRYLKSGIAAIAKSSGIEQVCGKDAKAKAKTNKKKHRAEKREKREKRKKKTKTKLRFFLRWRANWTRKGA